MSVALVGATHPAGACEHLIQNSSIKSKSCILWEVSPVPTCSFSPNRLGFKLSPAPQLLLHPPSWIASPAASQVSVHGDHRHKSQRTSRHSTGEMEEKTTLSSPGGCKPQAPCTGLVVNAQLVLALAWRQPLPPQPKRKQGPIVGEVLPCLPAQARLCTPRQLKGSSNAHARASVRCVACPQFRKTESGLWSQWSCDSCSEIFMALTSWTHIENSLSFWVPCSPKKRSKMSARWLWGHCKGSSAFRSRRIRPATYSLKHTAQYRSYFRQF